MTARMVGQPGSERTHKRKLERLRKTLTDKGWPQHRIDALIERRTAEYQEQRDAWEAGAARRARVIDETYERLSPKDTSHRPRHVDPLLRGAARATGHTATAVKRGTTITEYQHREASG